MLADSHSLLFPTINLHLSISFSFIFHLPYLFLPITLLLRLSQIACLRNSGLFCQVTIQIKYKLYEGPEFGLHFYRNLESGPSDALSIEMKKNFSIIYHDFNENRFRASEGKVLY